MVSQASESLVSWSLETREPLRIEASDPRSDNRRRFVDIARDVVVIRRAVAGIPMAIRVAPAAFRGVVLHINGLEDGRFHYEVRLLHRDPDLSVPLAEGEDEAAMEAKWREWVGFLRSPALVERTQSVDVQVNIDSVDLAWRLPNARRGGHMAIRRRPRFSRRRKVGARFPGKAACFDRRVLFDGPKSDR